LGRHEPSFGELLRNHRAAAGLTQEQLAAAADLSPHAVSALERGVRRVPRRSTILRLAGALGLDGDGRDALLTMALRPPPELAASSPPPRSQPPEPRSGIPPGPIACFVGRERELAEIEGQLGRGGRVAVNGLGGVGKTQLAVQYLHQRRTAYPDGVHWLRADQETSLVGDLASLAWRLGLPEREAPELERQIEAVLRWLSEHGRWLLVVDNVEPAVTDAVRRWLPSGLPGHVLLTSRTPMWSTRLRLEPLRLEAASRFLLQRTGQRDSEAAGTVAEMLGLLPLALEQAAAYLELSGRDLASYAELLRTRLVELMREGTPEGYPRPVATTWQLSFERMEGERPAAASLLRLCAFLAPSDIPISVIRAAAGELPDGLRAALDDDVELDRTIAALRRYSLVDRQGDGLRVHRLVQTVVRESMAASQRRLWLAAAIRLLRAAHPEQVETGDAWPLCARLLAHAQAVERLARDEPVEPAALAWLLDRAGSYLRARADFEPARYLMERALAIRERAFGADHPDTAASLNGLAALLWNQGELAAARSRYERALAIRERVLGSGHPETAESLNDLAILLMDQGELVAARRLHERALGIRTQTLARDHPSIAESLDNLGAVLQQQGEREAARPLVERALRIRERALGPDHPRTAFTLNNLAVLLQDLGRLTEARPLFARALAIREQQLGPDHPRTAASLDNLGWLLREQGELAAARHLHERALTIRERVLGGDHPHTGRSLHRLAVVLLALGHPALAVPRAERAAGVLERTLGPRHRWTIESRRTLEQVRAELPRQPGERTGAG
jgi:tetratricopeptide (TPR) repeat protein/transcriptional regulator with XRE-family HTH domain